MNILNLFLSLFIPLDPQICFDYQYLIDDSDYVPGRVCVEIEEEDILGAMYQCSFELERFYFQSEFLITSNCYVD